MVTKANKKALFMTLVDHVPQFEAPNATDSLCLRVAYNYYVPRHREMAMFVLTITTTIRPISLLLAHAHGVVKVGHAQSKLHVVNFCTVHPLLHAKGD